MSIVKRSENQSAVAGAAYQAGQRIFCEYDHEYKDYTRRTDVIFREILLPENAPEEYSDRQVLWNSAEAVEKCWNSQLARKIIMALPRELPSVVFPKLVSEYCRENFVSQGMCVDFAIHDSGTGNPHAHIMLTLRSIGHDGKWLPKCRKEYELDGNGQRVRLPSGEWKTRKVCTNDWNDSGNVEMWRQSWADMQNRYLREYGADAVVDLRSYQRQGLEQIPTIHLGQEASAMEKRGVHTYRGDANRNIGEANALIRIIRRMIQKLKDWIADLGNRTEKSAAEDDGDIVELLIDYMNQRNAERLDWSARARRNGSRDDTQKFVQNVEFLREKNIVTLRQLDERLDELQGSANRIKNQLRSNNRRITTIQKIFESAETLRVLQPVMDEYQKKKFKGAREKFAEEHKEELAAYRKARRYLEKNNGGVEVTADVLTGETARISEYNRDMTDRLADMKKELSQLRSVRYCVDRVLPKKETEQAGLAERLSHAKAEAEGERGEVREPRDRSEPEKHTPGRT